jgi:hypothetical protein
VPEHNALDALSVLESVLQSQAGTVNRQLIELVYAAAMKHQYDSPDDVALHESIRTIVTDYVTQQLSVNGTEVRE